MRRRRFLSYLLLAAAPAARAVEYARVVPGTGLVFPRDHGRHSAFRTEWWYVTGWVQDRDGRGTGIQVTFFRNRPGIAEDSRSRFAPTQLLFAHAAIADPALQRLLHDQRAAREGFGLAGAADDTTRVSIGDWSLALDGDTYRTRIVARDFTLDLAFAAKQPVLVQGDEGYSRKGPSPELASHYYSRPHLAVSGTIERDGRRREVTGDAWLDHEWSSDVMAKETAGWDWTGINLDDGAALMAFRMRDRGGGVLWAGGALRSADGATRMASPQDVRFEPLRGWKSRRTGVTYPVSMRVHVADRVLELVPRFDDQELDSRLSTGTIYWEGAVIARSDGRDVGRGYLELTGYGVPLIL